MPHRELTPQSVAWSDWQCRVGDVPAFILGSEIPGWDYSVPMMFSVTARPDMNLVTSLSGVLDPARIGLYVKVECPSSYYVQTFVRPASEAMDGALDLTLEVPAGVLAHDLFVERGVVLLQGGHGAPGAATRPGSRLLRDRHKVQIEGDGSRMAVEIAEFPEDADWGAAPWHVIIDYSDWTLDPYGRATRVLLSSKHPATVHLLDPGSEFFERYSVMIQLDVVRAHLIRAAMDGAEPPTRPDDGSVAAVMDQQCRILLDSDLANVLEEMKSGPEMLETRLKSALGFLAGS